MNVKFGFNSILLAAALAAMLIAPAETWAQKRKKPGDGPTVVDLHPAGALYSRARGISDAGQIVGEVDDVAGTWDANAATPTFTPLPGGALAGAFGQNEAGEIVGWSHYSGTPLYWESASANHPIALPLPGGATFGLARAISLDGVIVGNIDGGTAIAWRVVSGSVFGPAVLSSDGLALGVAISGPSTNRVVGESVAYGATFWDLSLSPDGSFTVTSTSSAHPTLTGIGAVANAITVDGDVTGHATGGTQAFVIRSGSLSLLRNGRREDWGVGRALNADRVVGASARTWRHDPDAAGWDSSNRNKHSSLLPSAWSDSEALGINATGAVVGYGRDGSGTSKAWLLR